MAADTADFLMLRAALSFCVWKRANLIAVHQQPDPVLQLFKLTAIDGNGFLSKTEQPPSLDLNRLYLAIGSPLNLHDLPEILAVRTENGHASHVSQCLATLRLPAGLRLTLCFLDFGPCCHRLSGLYSSDDGLTRLRQR